MRKILLGLALLSSMPASGSTIMNMLYDHSDSNFLKVVRGVKGIESCGSERSATTRLVKTYYVRSSKITLTKYSGLPSAYGGSYDLINDLAKNHYSTERAISMRELGSAANEKCDIYARTLSEEQERDSFSSKKGASHFIVYNSCIDGDRASLPGATKKWLDVVDATCDL